MKRAALAILASILLVGAGPSVNMAQKFSKPWQAAPDAVMGVVGTHDVEGCDRLVVKPSVNSSAGDPDNGDYMVYFTTDGKKFVAWEVLPAEDSMTGPMALPVGVPLPNPGMIPAN
jgi:hypothetical protein